MEVLKPPFTEEVLPYPVADYSFAQLVKSIIMSGSPATETTGVSLDKLHDFPQFRRMQGAEGILSRGLSSLTDDFNATYSRFIRDVVRPHLVGNGFLLYERHVNLRMHFGGEKAYDDAHTDFEYGHSPYEINFWVPITSVGGTASLWAESSPGLADFRSFDAVYGEAVRFYGNRCFHFRKDNETDRTRISFDFRVVRLQDLSRSGICLHAADSTTWKYWSAQCDLFGHYGLMGPQGEVERSGWEEMSLHEIVLATDGGPSTLTHARLSGLGETFHDSQGGHASRAAQKARSPSPEHRRRCLGEWGSERVARKRCPRCGWLANRAHLVETLTFANALGVWKPWIAENKDPFAPWGLGCVLCHDARRNGHTCVPKSLFTEFTYGSGLPGLLVRPLMRHGNHGVRQDRTWITANPEHYGIVRNVGHDIAVAAAAQALTI